MRTKMWIVLGIALAAVAVWWFVIRRPNIPDRVEKMGPLDLVTHTAWHLDGWNNGNLSWGTVESYSVRYHGKPFELEGQEPTSGRKVTYPRCNAFFTFPSDPPAVVVNVGDPVNTSYFYLLRESPQGLTNQYLAETREGPAAHMLDGPPEAASLSDQSTPNRRFASGHLLLLGSYSVLDTQTAHLYTIETLSGVDPVTRPLSVSPDKQSFVRTGLRSQAPGAVEHVLLDTNFVTGKVGTVPIDRTRMRYNYWQEIDEPWVQHHFEWKLQAGGPFQLTERVDFKPLPFHGNRSFAFNDSNCAQYSLINAKPEVFDRVVEFLSKQYQSSLQTNQGHHAELRIEGVIVKVDFKDRDLAIWYDTGTKSPILNQVADRVDDFLKTGACDSLFLPNS